MAGRRSRPSTKEGKTMRNFIQIVADSPEEIRRCDVFRLMEEARQQGRLEELIKWLSERQYSLKWGVWEEAENILQEMKER